jgi:putative MATE family efflux protein
MSKFGTDLTTGSIPRHLLTFSIPMLIVNLLNTGYGIINAIWLGNTIGENAVGAAAVSFPILLILIGLASGATMATTVLVSQYYGANDYVQVKNVINNSVTVALTLSLILTIGAVWSSEALLRWMNTPKVIYEMALSYLKIQLFGFILIYLSFLIMSILRGIGDTKTPLGFFAIGVGINAVLDPLLILGIGPFPKLGLNGAAFASVIAQFIALILGLIYLNRQDHLVAISPRNLRMEKKYIWQILKIGFPSMLEQSLVSIGGVFVTAFVNSFGAAAIAAYGATSRIDSLASMPAIAIGMAVTTLTGQNIGAGKPERVKEIFKWGLLMAAAISVVISLLAVSIPEFLIWIFIKDLNVVAIGVIYLRIVGSSYILFALLFVAISVINGAGHTISTMIISLIGLWVIRVPLAAYLCRTSLEIIGIWIAIVVSFAVVAGVSYFYYRLGRWKKAVHKFKV